jgi:hypothetical protein
VALGDRVLTSGEVLKPAPTHAFIGAGINTVARMPDRPWGFGTWEALGADGTATHFARERQATIELIARGAARSRERLWEGQRLLGRLQVMRDAVPLDPGARATLLSDIHHLRSLNEGVSRNAGQQMNFIAQAFGSPDAARVDAFLHGGPEPREAGSFSGTVAFCEEQGLPLAQWQDVMIDPAATATPPSPAAPP